MSDNFQEQDVTVTLESRKAKLRTRRRALIQGAADPALSAKQRTTVEYLASLRAALDPSDVGPALSELFMFAVNSRNVGLLRLLLPYVLGAPAESPDNSHGALDLLMSAMRSEPGLPAARTIDSTSVPLSVTEE